MSIIRGGGRTYGFDLDLIKSPSGRSSSSSSSPSSTISESSNSPLAISTKRPRTPRKRPNQSYSEATALLSTVYPNLFSANNLCKNSKSFSSLATSLISSSDLLPPFPVLNEAGFLIQSPSTHQQPCQLIRFQFNPSSPSEKSGIEYQEPSSPESADYDVESILDEEVGEGIDSIMGNLSMENCDTTFNSYCVNPHLGSLMGSGIRRKGEFGFGFGLGQNNLSEALRGANNGDWWRHTKAVPVTDIVRTFSTALPPLEKKKTKKKKKKKVAELDDEPEAKTMLATKATTKKTDAAFDDKLKCGLGLKLRHEDVLKAWSDRQFPFSSDSGTPQSSADIFARLSEIDLQPDNIEGGGGMREASVQRYREKRRTRLFSKKIRYQVRKVNADRRPRMKASGRFVKQPDLFQEAIDEESSQ